MVGFPVVLSGLYARHPADPSAKAGETQRPLAGAPRRRVVSPPPRLPLPLTSQHFAELGPRRGSRRPSRPDLPPPLESALLRVHQTEPLVLVPSALPAGGSGPFGETCPMFCAAYICHLQGHWPRLSLWKVLRTPRNDGRLPASTRHPRDGQLARHELQKQVRNPLGTQVLSPAIADCFRPLGPSVMFTRNHRKWRKAEAAGSEQAPGAQRRETPKIRPHVAPSF